jgi:hypothetical protein
MLRRAERGGGPGLPLLISAMVLFGTRSVQAGHAGRRCARAGLALEAGSKSTRRTGVTRGPSPTSRYATGDPPSRTPDSVQRTTALPLCPDGPGRYRGRLTLRSLSSGPTLIAGRTTRGLLVVAARDNDYVTPMLTADPPSPPRELWRRISIVSRSANRLGWWRPRRSSPAAGALTRVRRRWPVWRPPLLLPFYAVSADRRRSDPTSWPDISRGCRPCRGR